MNDDNGTRVVAEVRLAVAVRPVFGLADPSEQEAAVLDVQDALRLNGRFRDILDRVASQIADEILENADCTNVRDIEVARSAVDFALRTQYSSPPASCVQVSAQEAT